MRWIILSGVSAALSLSLFGCSDPPQEEVDPDAYVADARVQIDVAPILCNVPCERVECGADICGNDCGACATGSACQQGLCVVDCTPDCEGKQCGEDGCGGQCGQCSAEESCVAGACEAPCRADCAGRRCGDNGCGGACAPGCGKDDVCLEGISCCTPDCEGRACGDDGCGGSCGQCGAGEACDDGACRALCDPTCEGRACGDNGCGGVCGACAAGEGCVDGACQAGCAPSCEGRECGDDGCGGSCGQCQAGACQGGACVGACAPDCADKECGDNGCGDPCGICGAGEECLNNACAAICTPSCEGRVCGDNGCGGACGACALGDECDASGACVTSCAPNCADRECGEDGCGGTCGLCGAGEQCEGGACAPLCAPSCEGRECGDNGCGGSCGACSGGAQCSGGACVSETRLVDWCRFHWPDSLSLSPGEEALVYARVFEEGITDTTAGPDVDPGLTVELGFGPDGAAPEAWTTWLPAAPNPEWNDAASPGNDEYMVTLTAPAQGSYDMAFRATADNGAHYIYCDLTRGVGRDGSEDGYSPSSAASLHVGCTPACDGAACGDDGCGGSCGQCAQGSICEAGACVAQCAPSCAGKVCGDDGCGGSCGACENGQRCDAGQCVAGAPGVEWCRLQYPGALSVNAGGEVEAYAHVHVTGLTDLTEGPDPDPSLVVEVGLGPVDAHPEVWTTWHAAAPNPDFAGVGVEANDEYMALFDAPAAPGAYALAFRATRTGASYLYCDLNRGFGADGSNDGFALEDAGRLTVEACAPDCEGRACGDDGCGGTCGVCQGPDMCPLEGTGCLDFTQNSWCRYHWPPQPTAAPGEAFTAYARVYVPGITDRTSSTDDLTGDLQIAHAVMRPGGDPLTDGGDAFGWTPVTPNAGWTDRDHPGADEFSVEVTAPEAPGEYEMVFVMIWRGSHKVICDVDAGAGADGSEDGYDPPNPARLTVAE